MAEDRWQKLERIFADAREHAAEERADVIGRACGEDDALRHDALSLLGADAEACDFMNKPALDALSHRVAVEGWGLRGGDRIGAYTVVRMIGAGGMGEVWRAVDERLGREVAIKILLPHFARDPERLRRFSDEARLAGALNHSNILTVYDVGEHRGMPFIVAECLEVCGSSSWAVRSRCRRC
jgi:serine/threonine protein kinase